MTIHDNIGDDTPQSFNQPCSKCDKNSDKLDDVSPNVSVCDETSVRTKTDEIRRPCTHIDDVSTKTSEAEIKPNCAKLDDVESECAPSDTKPNNERDTVPNCDNVNVTIDPPCDSHNTDVDDIASHRAQIDDVISNHTHYEDTVSNFDDVTSNNTHLDDVTSNNTHFDDVTSNDTHFDDVTSNDLHFGEVTSNDTHFDDVRSNNTQYSDTSAIARRHQTIDVSNFTKNDDVTSRLTQNVDVANVAPNVIIPDGGWGWVVVFASFMIHVIADGIVYSFGIFFIEFLNYYGGSRAETAWVGSLLPGITLASGPIASALTNKYGCRTVTIAGSVVASAGFILSMFGPNLAYLYFSFGIMAGLGFGMIYLPAIVSVTQYFDKRRSFATGLAVCGSGIGTFVFAPLAHWLVKEYDWKGAILIEAAIVLNCVLSGFMFRPLEMKPIEEDHEQEMQTYISSSTVAHKLLHHDHDNVSSTVAHKLLNHDHDNGYMSSDDEGIHKSTSMVPAGRIRCDTWNASDNVDSRLLHVSTPKPVFTSTVAMSPTHLHPHMYSSRHTLGSGMLQRRDIFYSGSIYNIAQCRSNPGLYKNSVADNIHHDDDHDAAKSNKFLCCKNSPEITVILHEMLDLSLFKDPIFVLFVVSNFFTSIGFNMPFIYLPDRAVACGISDHKAAFLVSIIGIANTVGRIVFGWMADRSWVNRLMLYNTSLVICGVGTALSPVTDSFVGLAIYACVFGMFIGVYVGLTSVVLVDLLGLDKLTNAFGLVLLFQGLATFIGPPIAGWMYDVTGSYTYSFVVEGIMIAFSGAILFAIPFVRRRINANRSADTDAALVT